MKYGVKAWRALLSSDSTRSLCSRGAATRHDALFYSQGRRTRRGSTPIEGNKGNGRGKFVKAMMLFRPANLCRSTAMVKLNTGIRKLKDTLSEAIGHDNKRPLGYGDENQFSDRGASF